MRLSRYGIITLLILVLAFGIGYLVSDSSYGPSNTVRHLLSKRSGQSSSFVINHIPGVRVKVDNQLHAIALNDLGLTKQKVRNVKVFLHLLDESDLPPGAVNEGKGRDGTIWVITQPKRRDGGMGVDLYISRVLIDPLPKSDDDISRIIYRAIYLTYLLDIQGVVSVDDFNKYEINEKLNKLFREADSQNPVTYIRKAALEFRLVPQVQAQSCSCRIGTWQTEYRCSDTHALCSSEAQCSDYADCEPNDFCNDEYEGTIYGTCNVGSSCCTGGCDCSGSSTTDPVDPSDPSDPGDPGGGTSACSWCTSPSNCAANGGSSQDGITDYCSSSTDRPCCVDEYDPCETGNRCNVDPTWECCDWIGQWSTCNHTWEEGYYACNDGWCGDGEVNNGETCLSCAQDVGSCTGTLQGRVYLDNTNSASIQGNGNCSTSARTAGNSSMLGNVFMSKQGYSRSDAVDGNGFYQISNIVYANDFSVLGQNLGADYRFSCPPAGLYTDVDVNSTTDENVTITRDFYVARNQNPWFSVMGGEVKANGQGGTTLRNFVPDTCSGSSCFTSRRLDGGVGSSGPMLTAGGGGSIVGADEDGRGWVIADGVQKRRETFEYFKRQYNLGLNPTESSNFSGPQMLKPGSGVYWTVANDNPEQEKLFGENWEVQSNEKIVIFVDGNLLINRQVHVEPGGFLAFIVSGNIRFRDTMGRNNFINDNPIVEGVYIADGTVSTGTEGEDSDRRLIVAGTVVGWGGVNLERSLLFDSTHSGNTQHAAELFIYRPDFMFNLPDEMKTVRYLWQEVAPGGDIELRPGQDAYGN